MSIPSASPPVTGQEFINNVRINIKQTNAFQISDQTILDYANIFVTQDMPQEIQCLNYKTTYTFTTQTGVDRYNAPVNTYTSYFGSVFVSGYPVQTYIDIDQFQYIWLGNFQYNTVATGNGGAGPYSFVIPIPVIRGHIDVQDNLYPGVYINAVDISGNNMQVVDNGSGFFINADNVQCGTVNYLTGVCSVTFPSPTSSLIYSNSQIYSPGMPCACLLYNNTFTLRNVPNQAYTVSVGAYLNPTAFGALPAAYTKQLPIYNLFKYLVYGTARYILMQYKDLSQLEIVNGLYREQENMLLRLSTRQRFSKRTQTVFNNNAGYGWNNNFPYNQNG